MQKVLSLLDLNCTQPNGYKAYQDFLANNIYDHDLQVSWDMWSFVAFFSRRKTLADVASPFLVALGECFFTTQNNPGILSVDQRVISSNRFNLNIANLEKQLRSLAFQVSARIEAIYALYSLHMNKPKNSELPDLADEEAKKLIALLKAATAEQSLTLGQIALAQFLLGALEAIEIKSMSYSVSIVQERAFLAFKQAAAQGDSWSQFMLGQALHQPWVGVAYKEESTPETWIQKAADQGNFRAQCAYAMLIDPRLGQGNYGGEVRGTAVSYLRMAAIQGHPFACYFLSRYERGFHREQEHLFKAALQGILSARIALGDYFQAKKDIEHAILWYKKAAEFNDKEALDKLGEIYELKNDPKQAFECYKKIADTSRKDWDYPSLPKYDPRPPAGTTARCNYKLGLFYLNGVGTPGNAHTAMIHFRVAARLGLKEAQDQLQSPAMRALMQQLVTEVVNPPAAAASSAASPDPRGNAIHPGEKRKTVESNQDQLPSHRPRMAGDDELMIDDERSAPPVVVTNGLMSLAATVTHAKRVDEYADVVPKQEDTTTLVEQQSDNDETSCYRPGC